MMHLIDKSSLRHVDTLPKTLSQLNAIADNLKWESAIAFVRAYNYWQLMVREHGTLSVESREAFKAADKAERLYARRAKRY